MGGFILRCSVDAARSRTLDDDELVAAVGADLRTAIGLTTSPQAWTVTRWSHALPHYTVGHLDRVARIRADLPPTVTVAGAAYGGVGIPDCIRQGQEAGRQTLAALSSDS